MAASSVHDSTSRSDSYHGRWPVCPWSKDRSSRRRHGGQGDQLFLGRKPRTDSAREDGLLSVKLETRVIPGHPRGDRTGVTAGGRLEAVQVLGCALARRRTGRWPACRSAEL